MVTTIKRYPNRKLYNTETKRYITLDGIAALIREGEEVEVIDHATGEDLTTLTLTQIIFEQEKKASGFLPQSVLTGLIQAGGQRLDAIRRTLAVPREMLGPVEQEIDRRLQELMRQGELAREEGQRLRNKLLGWRWRQLTVTAEQQPTDLDALYDQLDLLVAKIDELLQEREA